MWLEDREKLGRELRCSYGDPVCVPSRVSCLAAFRVSDDAHSSLDRLHPFSEPGSALTAVCPGSV